MINVLEVAALEENHGIPAKELINEWPLEIKTVMDEGYSEHEVVQWKIEPLKRHTL